MPSIELSFTFCLLTFFHLVLSVWFDVQRAGKVGYHEAQVIEMDFNSPVKRVKFHFWRLSNASDEWVDVGSARIAPHVSTEAVLY